MDNEDGDCLSSAGLGSSHSLRPSSPRSDASCSGLSSLNNISCEPLPAIEGWSLSKSAEADWESMDDWVARAAKEDVVSWYLSELE